MSDVMEMVTEIEAEVTAIRLALYYLFHRLELGGVSVDIESDIKAMLDGCTPDEVALVILSRLDRLVA